MVVTVIIAALVLFVLGDILSGKNSLGFGGQDNDANVIAQTNDGAWTLDDIGPIAERLYRNQLNQDPNFQLDEEKRKQLFSQAWEDLMNEKLVRSEIEKSGIDVTDEDLKDLLMGLNPMESVKGDPSFQTDGKFDPMKVKMIYRQAKSNSQTKGLFLSYLENIRKSEREMRYAKFIAKTLYNTTAEAKFNDFVATGSVEAKVVALNFADVADKDIELSDADFQEYLDDHKEFYRNEKELRSVKYVRWNIVPSAEDSAYALEQANKTAAGLKRQSKPDTLGAIGFLTKSDLPEEAPVEIAEMVFPSQVGDVVGPIYKAEDGKYFVYQKVAENMDTVPRVRASHILIPSSGKLGDDSTIIADSIQAMAFAEGLYRKVMAGADFAELAKQYSVDGSASKGGDLGWSLASAYVPEFAKFCSSAQQGQVGMVKTQFGYHVIKMMEAPDYMRIKFTQNVFEISAGTQTVGIVDEESRGFRNKITEDPASFEKVQESMKLIPRIQDNISTESREVCGLQGADAKSLLFWLFDKDREANEISDVFAFEGQHVVIKVEQVRHRGYASVEELRETLEPLVRNHKKHLVLAAKLEAAKATAKTPEELAKAVGGKVELVSNLHMGQGFIPQYGSESAIMGACFGANLNALSSVIEGNNYAAVVFPIKRDEMDAKKEVASMNRNDDFMSQPQMILSSVKRVLVREAEVQDFRYKFDWN